MPTTERSRKSGAAFKPRTKEETTTQTSGTPRSLLAAVENLLSVKIGFDIACTTLDCVAFEETVIRCNADGTPNPDGAEYMGNRRSFGYFFDQGVNALEKDWNTIEQPVAFFNPEFSYIDPWVKAAAHFSAIRAHTGVGPRILSLLPAGVGTKWFKNHVAGKCDRYYLSPRIGFIDPSTGKPFQILDKKGKLKDASINRDCMLLDWSPPAMPVRGRFNTWCWDWATGELVAA